MIILALDLATISGYALGKPGQKQPQFGSLRFARAGASHEALFAGALTWASKHLKEWNPDRIVYELPLAVRWRRGASQQGNDEIAYGLPAIIQAVSHLRDIYDVRGVTTKDVRLHFIGENPPRKVAKKLTVKRCRALGWDVDDDNAGDACAIWSYACSLIDPALALRTVPLFNKALAL